MCNKEVFQQILQIDNRWQNYWVPHLDPNILWVIIFEMSNCEDEKLFHNFRNTRYPDDWISFKEENKLVKLAIVTGKEEYIKDTLHENYGFPRNRRKINTTSGLGKTKVKATNIQIKTPEENDYYVNVGQN